MRLSGAPLMARPRARRRGREAAPRTRCGDRATIAVAEREAGRSLAVRAMACGGHMNATDSQARLDAALGEVTSLLQRHRVLETWAHNQATRQREVVEALVHRQNVAELHQRLRALHPADLAYIVEALSPDDRA